MRSLPPALLQRHGVSVKSSDGKPEPPWRQVLRLNQSLWRQEQGMSAPLAPWGVKGSHLSEEAAKTGANLMSLMARESVAFALADSSKVVQLPRIYDNLLTSQALCFSLFGELSTNLGVASKVISVMLGHEVQVTRIELEHSPGRGDLSYTGDHSAADAYVEYQVGERRGFLCIEVKYFEDLVPWKDSKDPYRPRYSEVATQMGCFEEGHEATLRNPPLEQIWRDHLLAGSILHHPNRAFDEGYFVFLFPKINEACTSAVRAYRACLTNGDTFLTWTLEDLVNLLIEHDETDWAWSLKDRYLDFSRANRAYEDHYIRETTLWARTIRTDLGRLQTEEGHRVWFRPSSSGVGMVGLLPEKPQLGARYTSTRKILQDFEGEFSKHCDGQAPLRVTPEKGLQSYLLADALTNGRRMTVLDADIVFLTDEFVIPGIEGDQRLDLLALRSQPEGTRLVLIELKSERAMSELLRQTQRYGEFLDGHRERLGPLASAILGEPVTLTHHCEKWVVWPATGDGSEPRAGDFASVGVRVCGYSASQTGLTFKIEPDPKLC